MIWISMFANKGYFKFYGFELYVKFTNLIRIFLKPILEECDNGSGIKVWAQIESKLALENMESILEEADAVLLSRVSLTQDLPPEKLFLAQKKVLASCNKVQLLCSLSAQSQST